MDDLISRQAAIDVLKNRWKKTRNYEGIGDDIAEECELYLKQLPSAQPEFKERTEEFAQNVPKEDLISRKAAIEAMSESLKRVFPEHRQIAKKCLKALPSAQPEKRTETHACDLIDRQAAVDEVVAWLKDRMIDGKNGKPLTDRIKDLPPAQPESQWILCSEKMPEEHEWIGTKKFGTTISDEVYVTFENEKGERFCKHMTFQNGELSRYDKFYMDAWYKGSKPIAWAPLPDPYQKGAKD